MEYFGMILVLILVGTLNFLAGALYCFYKICKLYCEYRRQLQELNGELFDGGREGE